MIVTPLTPYLIGGVELREALHFISGNARFHRNEIPARSARIERDNFFLNCRTSAIALIALTVVKE
jgi:hypothetical protein